MSSGDVGRRRIWVVALLVCALAAAAFLAGAVFHLKSYWPFGNRYRFMGAASQTIDKPADKFSREEVVTGIEELVVEKYPLPFRDSPPTGPFAELSNTEFLVATRLGELHHVEIGGEAVKSELLGSLGVPEKMLRSGGVKGLLLLTPQTLLVSMNTYDASKSCYALGVFEFALDIPRKILEQRRKLFESEPCLPASGAKTLGPNPLGLEESGGRMLRLTDDSILVSVGTMSGLHGGDTGRILKIRLSDGASSVFVKGTRNPQGLFLDPESGTLFETEHGPRGGDEINVLLEGKDYGYPNVSYGTPYGGPYAPPEAEMPADARFGDHQGYELPLVAFVPSVGISNLIRYPASGKEFPRWQGDLLVESLRAETLFRVKVIDGRVILSEPMPFGERLRDIALLPNQSVALKTDSQQLIILSRPKPAVAGNK
jgi:hypothetical protein